MGRSQTKRGLGNIRSLPSGRYQLRYTDPNGNSKTAGTYGTKALAERALLSISKAIDGGTYQEQQGIYEGDIDPKALTLLELGTHWRQLRRNRRGQPLSPNTLAEYERLVGVVLEPLNSKPIREITTGQVAKWWEPESRRAPRQANAAYKHLNTLFKYAVKNRWLSDNPCTIEGANVYVPDRQPNVPDLQQVQIIESETAEPFRTVIALAAWGGLRKGEILELRRKDIEQVTGQDGATWLVVDISRGVVWDNTESIVRVPKTAGSIRKVTLPQRVNSIVVKHLATIPINPDALLFSSDPQGTKHWGEWKINKPWERARALAGYTGSFHSLRAFAATQFGLQGATVAELMDRLGHRNVRTAMRYQRTTGREMSLLSGMG
jgi:integrase